MFEERKLPNRQVQRSSLLPFLSSYLSFPSLDYSSSFTRNRDERLDPESIFAYLELDRSDEGETASMGSGIPGSWNVDCVAGHRQALNAMTVLVPVIVSILDP